MNFSSIFNSKLRSYQVRNRLHHEKVDKLAYIYMNSCVFRGIAVKDQLGFKLPPNIELELEDDVLMLEEEDDEDSSDDEDINKM